MDARIGTKNEKGQVLTWPSLNGLGGPFVKSQALTTVPLNDAGTLFYVLPPGVAIADEHDALVALATPAAPAPQAVVAEAVADETPQEVSKPKRGGSGN